MDLKIYGFPQSRTFRVLWMAEEIRLAKGIDYQHDGRIFSSGPERDKLLSLNPMGQVPVIEDDGFVLRESMAINLYLSKKHDCLAVSTPEQEALAWQWSFWVMTSVDSVVLDYLRFKLGILGAQKDEQRTRELEVQLAKPVQVLNSELEMKSYLLGDEFCVADLNVASVFVWAQLGQLPMDHATHLQDWLSRCLGREPARLAQSKT